MATPQQIEAAIKQISDQQSFINILLKQTLNWQIPDGIENIEEMSYIWPAPYLRAEGLDEKVVEGRALQIQPLHGHEEWGIFLLEFNNSDVFIKGRGLAGPLRQVLRGLVRKRREQSNRLGWDREDLLFICTYNYQHYRFAYFRAPKEKEKTSPLAMFGWNYNDNEMRTLCQHNLPFLESDKLNNWQQAFSIEKVTKEFYEAYANLFKVAEDHIGNANKGLKNDKLRFFTQMLFNRLMFLRFIEKKGWLKFGEGNNYLKNLFSAGGINGKSFYASRLFPLFFEGLALEQSNCRDKVGDVPFLNGGLFEITELDKSINDIPNEVFTGIIGDGGLFYHFNFTVEESTPFDIEVAVDPEMLGKVFEKLVTGRHETGSYYTPKSVVSFMCREAIKGYLCEKTLASREAIEKLVDEHEIEDGGLTEKHGNDILHCLETLKAIDPACGSGAYLLGLLHELIAIRRTLQNQKLISDPDFLYELKRETISNCLYGVDIDEFATNIAKLRLWLSLAVEADEPQPLPNLDFKIETGDSVLGPCEKTLGPMFEKEANQLSQEIADLKRKHESAHDDNKKQLFKDVQKKINYLKGFITKDKEEKIIIWLADFAEVFINGGFNIVLANPPYIRQELIKGIKPRLAGIYPDTYMGTADLYTFFYARAVEMLGHGGMLVFISSNKWFRANYGQKLRKYLADNCGIHSITDFGELPVFETAATFPMIFVAQKTEKKVDTTFTQVKSLNSPYPDVKAIIQLNGNILPVGAIEGDSWDLTDLETLRILRKMESSNILLEESLGEKIYVGIKTGFNKAFFIDSKTKKLLISEDPDSEDIIKRLVKGDDVRKWHITEKDNWIIFTRRGIDIDSYPAIKKYLQQYRIQLEPRPLDWEEKHPNENWPGRKPGSYQWYEIQDNVAYYEKFSGPQMLLPDIAKEPRATLVNTEIYPDMTAFTIPTKNLFILGILNSSITWKYLSVKAAVLGDADKSGRLRLKRQYVSQLPIPETPAKDKLEIEKLVQKCLDAEGQNCEKWEKEIDKIVTKLYGLEGLLCQIPK